MKISKLEEMLKHCRENFGDVEISFGFCNNDLSFCNCDVYIEFDEREENPELNITVLP